MFKDTRPWYAKAWEWIWEPRRLVGLYLLNGWLRIEFGSGSSWGNVGPSVRLLQWDDCIPDLLEIVSIGFLTFGLNINTGKP